MSRLSKIALLALAAGLGSAAPAQARPEISFEARSAKPGFVAIRIRSDRDRSDQRNWHGNWQGRWNVQIPFADLQGITPQAFDTPGPIRFAYVRPAGRLNCEGTARDDHGLGSCTFAPDANFAGALTARGIARPDEEEFLGLAMSGVRIELVDALKQARLGTPTLEQLIGLGIFKVTPDFVQAMADGTRMDMRISDLISFKIFKITPEMVRDFAALGYRDLQAKDLVQFKIHGISAATVRELAELGYRDLPVQTLIRMKLFGVTPAYVRRVQATADATARLSAEQLVQRRLTGRMPRFDQEWAQRERRRRPYR